MSGVLFFIGIVGVIGLTLLGAMLLLCKHRR